MIKSNKKVFIFYPYNNGNNKAKSMKSIFETIQNETHKTGIMYNADVSDITIKKLDDVENEWKKADFVLTNSKITVGINYELDDFESVFLSVAGFSSVRDVIQASARLRQINSNHIYVHFMDKFNTNKTFSPNSSLLDTCSIYDSLIKNIRVEKLAPLKTTFYKFCKVAGYSINKDITINDITDEINNNLNEILKDASFKIEFDNIDDLTDREAQFIQNRIMMNEATFNDKLQLKKYFFIKKFKDDVIISIPKHIQDDDIFIRDDDDIIKQQSKIEYDEEIKYMFNNNYLNFIDGVIKSQYLEGDEHIFHKIKTLNNNATIMPADELIKKLKFNEDILDDIFISKSNHGWTFKDLKRTSKPHIIYRDMLEKVFCKKIIDSKQNKHKETIFYISENKRNLHDYCLTHCNSIQLGEEREAQVPSAMHMQYAFRRGSTANREAV